MPLPQPLPENVGKDAFARIERGATEGINYAMQAKQLALQEQELKYKYEQLAQTKAENVFGVGMKFAELVKKTRELPGGVGRTMVKAYAKQFEALGYPMSDVTQAMIVDEEAAKSLVGFQQALQEGYASGDLTSKAPAVEAFLKSWGAESGPEAVDKFMGNMAATERAAMAQKMQTQRAQMAQQEQNQRAELAQRGADRRNERSQRGADERKFKEQEFNYAKEYRQKKAEYNDSEKPFKTIFQMVKDDPQLKNPQARFNLVTTSRQLFEGRPSSVQMGELQSIVRQMPGYQQWIEQAKNLGKPTQVTPEIARQTYKIVQGAYEQFKERKRGMQESYYKGAGENGFSARKVLGDDMDQFTKSAAGTKAKEASLKGNPEFEKSVTSRVQMLEKKLGKKLNPAQVDIVRQQLAGSKK